MLGVVAVLFYATGRAGDGAVVGDDPVRRLRDDADAKSA
jgi:hypothetical protein